MKRLNAGRVIGLDQRVPLSFLDQGMTSLLETGVVPKEELHSLLLTVTKGANRAGKALSYAGRILSADNPLMQALKERFTARTYARLPNGERKILMLCLSALTYPIIYDALIIAGTQLKIQSTVNRAFINKKLSGKYGTNRTFEHAVDALIPMILETRLLLRLKTGLYSLPEKKPSLSPFTREAWTLTGNTISGSGPLPQQEISHRPWNCFIEGE